MKKLFITFLALAGIFAGAKAQESIERDSLELLKAELEIANTELARLDAENQQLAQAD